MTFPGRLIVSDGQVTWSESEQRVGSGRIQVLKVPIKNEYESIRGLIREGATATVLPSVRVMGFECAVLELRTATDPADDPMTWTYWFSQEYGEKIKMVGESSRHGQTWSATDLQLVERARPELFSYTPALETEIIDRTPSAGEASKKQDVPRLEHRLKKTLSTIRLQLKLYEIQHDGFPDDHTTITAQMTQPTRVERKTYGPYFREWPKNPFTNTSDVSDKRVQADGTNGSAWYYKDGVLRANDSLAHFNMEIPPERR